LLNTALPILFPRRGQQSAPDPFPPVLGVDKTAQLDLRPRRQAHEPYQRSRNVVQQMAQFSVHQIPRRLHEPREVQAFVPPAECREMFNSGAVLTIQCLLSEQTLLMIDHPVLSNRRGPSGSMGRSGYMDFIASQC